MTGDNHVDAGGLADYAQNLTLGIRADNEVLSGDVLAQTGVIDQHREVGIDVRRLDLVEHLLNLVDHVAGIGVRLARNRAVFRVAEGHVGVVVGNVPAGAVGVQIGRAHV